MSIPKILSPEWIEFLGDEFEKPYFKEIIKHYNHAIAQRQIIFPPRELTFNAFNLTPPHKVQIVILGQDPYHGSYMYNDCGVLREIPQAMGLSFSVPRCVPIPPSLKNIYKELEQSLGLVMPNTGDLTAWAKRGALLLNSIFSVQKGMASSHKSFGWEKFSDAVITRLSTQREGIIFMLWGNYAKQKIPLIDTRKHFIITAPHPSPLARGFVGSGVFLKAQQTLQQAGKTPFDWRVE